MSAAFTGGQLQAVLNDPSVSVSRADVESNRDEEESRPLLPIPPANESVLQHYVTAVLPHIMTGLQGESDGAPHAPASLSSVPEMYMQRYFSLEDPHTLAKILPEGGVRVPTDMLQHKLSHYLDLVEQHLNERLGEKTEFFLDALSAIQELQSYISSVNAHCQYLRSHMETIKQDSTVAGLRVLGLLQRRYRLTLVVEKAQLIQTARNAQQTVHLLAGSSDYQSAMDLIHRTIEIVTHDLIRVQALRQMTSELDMVQQSVQARIQTDFGNIATDIISAAVVSVRQQRRAKREGAEVVGEGDEEDSGLQDLERVVATLSRLGLDTLATALASYRSQLTKLCKRVVKETVSQACQEVDTGSSNPPPPDTGASPAPEVHEEVKKGKQKAEDLVKQLQSFNGTQFRALLSDVFEDCLEMMTAVMRVHSLVDRAISNEESRNAVSLHTSTTSNNPNIDSGSAISSSSHPSAPSRNAELRSDSFAAVHTTCEIAHTRCAQLLVIYSQVAAKYSTVEDYSATVAACTQFADKSERICESSTPSPLRSALVQQTQEFVRKQHKRNTERVLALLENENWKQATVPHEFPDMLSSLLLVNTAVEQPIDGTEQRYLRINGKQFCVVGSTLMLLKILCDYVTLAKQLSTAATVSLDCVMDILKLFNSRTCQLILGAGAMGVAGLKSITAKHLALASQAMGTVLELLPSLQEAISRCLPPAHRQLCTQSLTRVVEDFTMHQAEIFSKIVGIMAERSTIHCKTIRTIAWDTDAQAPSQPMRELVRETTTLHNLLNKVLPTLQMQSIFARVFSKLEQIIIDAYKSLNIQTPEGKRRLFTDARYLIDEMRRLDVLNDPPPLERVEEWASYFLQTVSLGTAPTHTTA